MMRTIALFAQQLRFSHTHIRHKYDPIIIGSIGTIGIFTIFSIKGAKYNPIIFCVMDQMPAKHVKQESPSENIKKMECDSAKDMNKEQ